MAAYYNEFDPFAAAWLRNLIAAGHIAPGEVDDRSILDVRPADLRGYDQVHFFAGIGVWSRALRDAGWPFDRGSIWTGSCPCQPFSTAGKGKGFADERHLWPLWFHLIEHCEPECILGEQVEGKDGRAWLDLVFADLEGLGYSCGAVVAPAAGFGAPHQRHRLYWMAYANDARSQGRGVGGDGADQRSARQGSLAGGLGHSKRLGTGRDAGAGFGAQGGPSLRPVGDNAGSSGAIGGLADAECQRAVGRDPDEERPADARSGCVGELFPTVGQGSHLGGLADADIRTGGQGRAINGGRDPRGHAVEWAGPCGGSGSFARPGPTNGLWQPADWLLCRDQKWRPVEARPQPLVDGSAESLGRVRPEILSEVEEEVSALAVESQVCGRSLVRNLREALGAEAKRIWSAGRLPGLCEAPFLLALLRQLETQGWRFSEGDALPRAEASGIGVRGVRSVGSTTGAPHQRGLVGQPTGEHPDTLHLLSSLLARHAQAAWGDAYAAYAEIGFPLGTDSRSRVGRLRGYGNALCLAQAVAFVEAAIDVMDPGDDVTCG